MADERIDPTSAHPVVWGDHIHRYQWAQAFCTGTVLDLASGSGYGSEALLSNNQVKNYVGLDLSLEALSTAQALFAGGDVRFVQADGGAIPLATETIDVAVSFETLEHIHKPELLVDELARVLKPNGLLIGSVPSSELEELSGKIYGPNPFHVNRFSETRLVRMLSRRFAALHLYEQSIEIVSLLGPKDTRVSSSFAPLRNPRNTALSPGCVLFLAGKSGDRFREFDHLGNTGSLLPITSLLKHEAPSNEYVRGLVAQLEGERSGHQRLQQSYSLQSSNLIELKEANSIQSRELEGLKTRVGELIDRTAELSGALALKDEREAALRNSLVEANEHILSLELERQGLLDSNALLAKQTVSASRVIEDLNSRVSQLDTELRGVLNTRSHRLVQKIVNSPARAFVVSAGRWLMPEKGPALESISTPANSVLHVEAQATAQPSTGESQIEIETQTSRPAARRSYSPTEAAWIEETAKSPQPVSLSHPHWYGIRASANQLFGALYYAEDNLDEESGAHLGRMLLESQCTALVIQGYPRTYQHVLDYLYKVAPQLPVFIIWHGSFVQARLDYDWGAFSTVLDLCRQGRFKKIGLVKKGMAEILTASGFKSGFVMNRVRQIASIPSAPLLGGPHLGVWGLSTDNWLKPPFAMLAAAKLVPNSVVHSSTISERVASFCDSFGINVRGSGVPIPQAEMPHALSQMHLNLYVSLSECAPMLPLESLGAGVPCLFGPNSHYFEDHEYLRGRLVVPHPDDAFKIAEYSERAIAERDAIITAYHEYAPSYNKRAHKSLEDFLETTVPEV
jgi:SAM-dependent methyltransferase